MQLQRLLLIIGFLAVLTLLGASQQSGTVIQVNCPQSFGCLNLLGQAIETAPEGAVIQVGSGTYYELSIVIEKSLTVRGTRDAADSKVINTSIIAVQPGALFTIKTSNHPISVLFEDLRIQNSMLAVDPIAKGGVGVGLNVQGSLDANPEELIVLLRNSTLATAGGVINLLGKAQVTLQGNRIQSSAIIGAENGGLLIIESNEMFSDGNLGGSSVAMAVLTNVEARFQNNLISSGAARQSSISILALGGQYSFVENRFDDHRVAVALGGKGTAEFRANVFSNNSIGIWLETPPCVPNPEPELRFNGTIAGSDNRFSFNTADLCPALNEYPWPPDFIKNP